MDFKILFKEHLCADKNETDNKSLHSKHCIINIYNIYILHIKRKL